MGGPEYNKPVIVAVHHPEHLGAAIDAIENPEGFSNVMSELAPRIQSGEVPPPPGIDPQSLTPLPGTFPEHQAKTSSFWNDLAMGGLAAGGLALAIPTGGADLPEVAAGEAALEGGGAAAEGADAAGQAANASKNAGGLMSKALGVGGQAAKAEGITSLINQGTGMATNALGLGGGASGGGGGGTGYSGPLQQFTHVQGSILAALVESDYETPSSVPDIGVKHDDPEDVDQKEFNDQDKSPENLLNPNLQDSGNSGEDAVRDKMDKPTQADQNAFHPDSPAIKRMEMLLPLIEHHYHSGEPGINDPMLRELHEMLEAESPGYLNNADHEMADRFMRSKGQPVHARLAALEQVGVDPRAEQDRRGEERRRWTDQDEARYQQELAERKQKGVSQIEIQRIFGPEAEGRRQEERRQQEERRRANPTPIPCAACHAGTIQGNACTNCGITIPELLDRPTSREALVQPMGQGGLVQNQQALDPTGADPKNQPQVPVGQHLNGPHNVPQKRQYPQELPTPDELINPEQMVGPMNPEMEAARASHTDILAALVEGANHQGPVTPEQVASVQQWLIQHGRTHEVPNVELDPGNPEYVKILKEIQGEDNVPPTITPEEQTQVQPPQAPPGAPGSSMPVPGMAPGEAGGAPMQPMSHRIANEWPNEVGEWPWDVKHEPEVDPETGIESIHLPPHYPNVLKALKRYEQTPEVAQAVQEHEDYLDHIGYPHRENAMMEAPTVEHPGPHTGGADNIAPRCPKCESGTTGMMADGDGHARCNACGHVWKVENALSDDNTQATSLMSSFNPDDLWSHVASPESDARPKHLDQANPVGVPAAQQEEQQNQGEDQDSSVVWKDTSGEKLIAGQNYEMKNPSYALPDLIRVERVKPDGIDVTLLGTYANDPSQQDPSRLTSSTPISKEDMELQELTFEPVAKSQEDRGNEPPPGEQAPGMPPVRPTTDEQTAREPAMAHVAEGVCPKCGSVEHTAAMISPEEGVYGTEYDCYYCGHVWVTEERDDPRLAGLVREGEDWVNPNAEWLREDDDAEDLSPRALGMSQASQQSKNIGDIAARDPRRAAVRDYLESEGRERQERVAGRHFTPRQQRELIDEDGRARNSDLLDLEGTHYKVRDSYDSKAKPERVRDNDLFLGI